MTSNPETTAPETFEEFLAYAYEHREKSLMEEIVVLPQDEQEKALEGIDPEVLLYDWHSWARPSQILPEGDWVTALLLAGRGFGKSRCGAEWIREKARRPNTRFSLLGRTAADVRDVMIMGESGILNISPPSERPEYIPSKRLLEWSNGSQALLFSSQEPSQLRGPQSHFAWADEIGTYTHVPDESGLTSWQNLRIGLRLGEHPQVIVTTTPKRLPAIIELLEEAATVRSGTIVIRGRTIDNVMNLPRSYLETLFNLYSSSFIWAQEIEGLLVEGLEGALWSEEIIEQFRIKGLLDVSKIPLRVVAVDPSVAENPKDECGIVVVGSTVERRLDRRHAYVLEDATIHGSPEVWVKAVADAVKRWKAPVVVEGNQGQALLSMAMRSAGITVPIFTVNARQNKQTRAEPAAVAYQAGRVHHVNYLPQLETQMTTWLPAESKKSPDRMDALVWGITALLVSPPKGLHQGPIRAKSPAQRRLQGVRKQSYAGHRSRRAA